MFVMLFVVKVLLICDDCGKTKEEATETDSEISSRTIRRVVPLLRDLIEAKTAHWLRGMVIATGKRRQYCPKCKAVHTAKVRALPPHSSSETAA